MAFRKPFINLLQGNKKSCWFCKESLILQETEFEMKRINANKSMIVKEIIYFCQKCHCYYITKQLSYALVHKYPGYYVDVSLYDIKQKIKTEKTAIPNNNITPNYNLNDKVNSNNRHIYQGFSTKKESSKSVSPSKAKSGSTLFPKVFFSDTYSVNHNICPFCSSVMNKELVNLPIINSEGNVIRYYAESAKYCHNCRKAYISDTEIKYLLWKINNSFATNSILTIKFENTDINQEQDNNHLYISTHHNTYLIYTPNNDYPCDEPTSSEFMNLNSQSFLGKRGYSVNQSEKMRHYILTEAVEIYGKRKVTDHLLFLISTRKAQINGALKYANAIKIWQSDLNFIYNL